MSRAGGKLAGTTANDNAPENERVIRGVEFAERGDLPAAAQAAAITPAIAVFCAAAAVAA